ncbi:MAG: cupin domain-containing protein [Gaiellales bacterium]
MDVNVFGDEWDGANDRPGWQHRRLSVGRRLGAERLGATAYRIEPGQRNFPYHYHYALEELLVVLEGAPTLRDPAGERVLSPGDTVLFRRGPSGAHQLRNDTDRPVRVLMVSSQADVEVVTYPDSDKVGASARAPDGSSFRVLSPSTTDVGYCDGED